MRKLCRIILKYVLMVLLIFSSATAIYINHSGNQYDPICEIQKLKSQNHRDDALDLAIFYRENHTIDAENFTKHW